MCNSHFQEPGRRSAAQEGEAGPGLPVEATACWLCTGTFPFLQLHWIISPNSTSCSLQFPTCALLATSRLPLPFRTLFKCDKRCLREGTEWAGAGLSCGLSLACHAGPGRQHYHRAHELAPAPRGPLSPQCGSRGY